MASKEPPQDLHEELVERYLRGDSEACEQLLTTLTHRQRVERLARQHTTGTEVPWEEAAQEAHLKVLQAAKNRIFGQGGASEFYSWAAEVAENAIFDLLIERYLQADSQACEQLLTNPAHRQRVDRLAQKYTTGTSVPWEEAAQQAHLKVLQAARSGSFRQGGAREFYRWAAKVAENAIIDSVRKEKRKLGGRRLVSLDRQIPETDMTLGESIADDFDLWDEVERGDLVLKAREAIETIDRRYPKKGYLALWTGLLQEKDVSQIAAALGVKQPEISKRWRELSSRIAGELGLLTLEQVEREVRAIRQGRGKGRKRSDTQW